LNFPAGEGELWLPGGATGAFAKGAVLPKQPLEVEMSASHSSHSTLIPPIVPPSAAAERPGRFSRIFIACLERVVRSADSYAAAVHLHELEDWALQDVGLARADIEAAVRGSLPTGHAPPGHAGEGAASWN
jgi:uncharacterized protein YjiS (DUF1127 family)